MVLIKQAIFIRLVITFLTIIFNYLLEDYDSSIHLPGSHVPQTLIGKVFSGFAKWDALFFLQIAHEGYLYEKNHAFFPVFPLAIRGFGYVLTPFLPFCSKDEVYLIAGIGISWLSFLLSLWAMEKLTKVLFKDESFVKNSSLLYIFTPASIFLVAIYSEALFSFFSVFGLYILYRGGFYYTEKGIWIKSSGKNRFLASILFCLSTGTRSNGSLLFIFQIAISINELINLYLFKKLEPSQIFKQLFTLLITGLIHSSPIFLVLGNGYTIYCKDMGSPYCFSYFPSIYNYVQEKYWNVGLFKYWELKQVPNFLLALPMIYLSTKAIFAYIKADYSKFFSFGAICKDSSSKKPHFFHAITAPFILYWLINTLILTFLANTQIITRALCSLPVLYWYLSHTLHSQPWLLLFFSSYSLIGLNLFSNFYPWT